MRSIESNFLRRTSLLSPSDPPAYRTANEGGTSPLLLLCDHAANAVPEALGSLGLCDADLGRHIAWDLGAEALTRQLAERLGATAVLSSFSRLVIDCNRALGDRTCMAEQSDGTLVPGNKGLDATQRSERAEALYWPYHRYVATVLDAFAARGVTPAVISVHSFTPHMNGVARPWQIGVLWDRDARISRPLLETLSRDQSITVGDNEPYSLRGPVDFTLPHHAVARGLPHVLIESRQDELDEPEGVARVAGLLHGALAPILSDPSLFRAIL
jgi:predicted N-formylglutamate amidohydrolase